VCVCVYVYMYIYVCTYIYQWTYHAFQICVLHISYSRQREECSTHEGTNQYGPIYINAKQCESIKECITHKGIERAPKRARKVSNHFRTCWKTDKSKHQTRGCRKSCRYVHMSTCSYVCCLYMYAWMYHAYAWDDSRQTSLPPTHIHSSRVYACTMHTQMQVPWVTLMTELNWGIAPPPRTDELFCITEADTLTWLPSFTQIEPPFAPASLNEKIILHKILKSRCPCTFIRESH